MIISYMKSSDFRELKVWQKAVDLAIDVYNLTRQLPKEEKFALSDQMRRAAISVPSNIAEGHGRDSSKDFVRFLSMSRGSLRELSTQLEISYRLQFIEKTKNIEISEKITEIDKMLTALATNWQLKTDN